MLKRILNDIKLLSELDCNVEIEEDNPSKISFDVQGPNDCIYETGKWKIVVEFPKEYPYKSPSVGFLNKIYHPNIDFNSGSICLDVLNTEWTPIYNIKHIYETFIPQLLQYPNADDPLNEEAAALYLTNKDKYNEKVIEYINKYGIQ